MKKILFTLLSVAALAAPAQQPAAQPSSVFGLSVRFEHLEFVRGEPIVISGSLRNNSRAAFIIDDYGDYKNNGISVYVRDMTSRSLLTPRDGVSESMVPRFTVTPGSEKQFSLNLRDVYDFKRQGLYHATVIVRRGEEMVVSKPIAFTIVEGIELQSAVRALSADETHPIRFSLLCWERDKRRDLFARITEPGHPDRVLGFASLGATVSVGNPSVLFGDDDTVTVVQQISRDRYTRTVLGFADRRFEILERDDNMMSADAVLENMNIRMATEQLMQGSGKTQPEAGRKGFSERHRKAEEKK